MAGKKTILVVEDNSINMRLVVYRLELQGFDVFQAIDGEKCLEMLKTVKPDLVLLDIHLPDLSGIEVIKKIKEDKSNGLVKIVALTASAMKENQEEIMNAGFDGLLFKPIDKDMFDGKIKQILGTV